MNGKLNLPINTVIGVSLLVLLLVPALYFAKPVLLPYGDKYVRGTAV